jgi:hypothetical protein
MAAALRYVSPPEPSVPVPNTMAFVAIRMDRRQGARSRPPLEDQPTDPAAGRNRGYLEDRTLHY